MQNEEGGHAVRSHPRERGAGTPGRAALCADSEERDGIGVKTARSGPRLGARARTARRPMTAIRNERIEAALGRALSGGDARELIELLGRFSGLPGPRPNMDLARAVGQALAEGAGGERVLAS